MGGVRPPERNGLKQAERTIYYLICASLGLTATTWDNRGSSTKGRKMPYPEGACTLEPLRGTSFGLDAG